MSVPEPLFPYKPSRCLLSIYFTLDNMVIPTRLLKVRGKDFGEGCGELAGSEREEVFYATPMILIARRINGMHMVEAREKVHFAASASTMKGTGEHFWAFIEANV